MLLRQQARRKPQQLLWGHDTFSRSDIHAEIHRLCTNQSIKLYQNSAGSWLPKNAHMRLPRPPAVPHCPIFRFSSASMSSTSSFAAAASCSAVFAAD